MYHLFIFSINSNTSNANAWRQYILQTKTLQWRFLEIQTTTCIPIPVDFWSVKTNFKKFLKKRQSKKKSKFFAIVVIELNIPNEEKHTYIRTHIQTRKETNKMQCQTPLNNNNNNWGSNAYTPVKSNVKIEEVTDKLNYKMPFVLRGRSGDSVDNVDNVENVDNVDSSSNKKIKIEVKEEINEEVYKETKRINGQDEEYDEHEIQQVGLNNNNDSLVMFNMRNNIMDNLQLAELNNNKQLALIDKRKFYQPPIWRVNDLTYYTRKNRKPEIYYYLSNEYYAVMKDGRGWITFYSYSGNKQSITKYVDLIAYNNSKAITTVNGEQQYTPYQLKQLEEMYTKSRLKHEKEMQEKEKRELKGLPPILRKDAASSSSNSSNRMIETANGKKKMVCFNKNNTTDVNDDDLYEDGIIYKEVKKSGDKYHYERKYVMGRVLKQKPLTAYEMKKDPNASEDEVLSYIDNLLDISERRDDVDEETKKEIIAAEKRKEAKRQYEEQADARKRAKEAKLAAAAGTTTSTTTTTTTSTAIVVANGNVYDRKSSTVFIDNPDNYSSRKPKYTDIELGDNMDGHVEVEQAVVDDSFFYNLETEDITCENRYEIYNMITNPYFLGFQAVRGELGCPEFQGITDSVRLIGYGEVPWDEMEIFYLCSFKCRFTRTFATIWVGSAVLSWIPIYRPRYLAYVDLNKDTVESNALAAKFCNGDPILFYEQMKKFWRQCKKHKHYNNKFGK